VAIVAEHLDKRFGTERVVDDVSFDVKEGEFVALLGPSGGGKSTVLRIIAGLEAPDVGRVLIFDRDATNEKVQDRAVGFVFQHYALFKHMTVRQNIGFGLEVRGEKRAAVARAVDELLELVQLRGLGDRFPSQLSGGQRQRVALARALAPRPAVILLDEPFGALDAKVRVELRSWLKQLQRERGITCIFVTHDQEEAMDLADRVVILHRGKVEQIGTPDEVYDQPKTPFVASFVGSSNVLSGAVAKDGAELALSAKRTDGSDPPPGELDGADIRAFVRHHEIEILKNGDVPSDANALVMTATVVRLSRIGWVAKVDLTLADGQSMIAELPKEKAASMQIAEGDRVRVALRSPHLFVDDYAI